jgi:hypothetical protein
MVRWITIRKIICRFYLGFWASFISNHFAKLFILSEGGLS